MNKRVFTLSASALLMVFSLGLVSAYYGSFSSFSLSDLLSGIDSSTMLLGSVFIICFSLIYFALGRFFKKADGTPNTTIAAVIGLVISLFIIYGINQSDMDVQSLLFNVGVSESLTQTVAPFILIFGAIFLIWRLGVDYFFLIFGALFMIVAFFTNWVYEKGMVGIIGFFLLIIGLWLHRRRTRVTGGGGGGGRGILGGLIHGTRRIVEGGTDRLQGAMDARAQRRNAYNQLTAQIQNLNQRIGDLVADLSRLQRRRLPNRNQRQEAVLQQEILTLQRQRNQLQAQLASLR
jgi:hypothetical protein